MDEAGEEAVEEELAAGFEIDEAEGGEAVDGVLTLEGGVGVVCDRGLFFGRGGGGEGEEEKVAGDQLAGSEAGGVGEELAGDTVDGIGGGEWR